MTDIKSTLDNLDAELASLNTRLSTATALGSKEAAVGAATRVASAAIQSLRDRVKAASDLITDRYGPQVTEALAARKLALTAADTASTQGNPPPLADAQEAALKKTVLNANGVPDASVDAQAAAAVAAITKVDTDIAALGTDAKGTLKKKQDDLVTAQNALAVAREAALAVLAKIVGSGADLRAKLNAAVAHRLDAQNLAAAADKVSHHAAIVAYAAYAADRTALMTEKAADLDGAKLKKEWEDAADAWLAAEVAVAAADEDVIKQQLEVDMQLADQAAQLKTRDAAATAAVTVAIP